MTFKLTHQPGWNDFLHLLQNIENTRELDELMRLLLTPEECEQLATRVLIVKDLLEGVKSQRDIAAEHKISIAKITRGSNSLKFIGDQLRDFLRKQLTEQQ